MAEQSDDASASSGEVAPSPWLVRIGSDEHRAPDPATLHQWCHEGRIPREALILAPDTAAWVRADTSEFAASFPTVVAFAKPKSSGVAFLVWGLVCIVVGVLLSGTCIGIVVGIPLVIAGIVLATVGSIRLRKAQFDNLQKSIERGIVSGMAAKTSTCKSCGATVQQTARFCASCGVNFDSA